MRCAGLQAGISAGSATAHMIGAMRGGRSSRLVSRAPRPSRCYAAFHHGLLAVAIAFGFLWPSPFAPSAIAPLAASSGSQAGPAVADLPPAIPIFPLDDIMLFPHASRPLHIFEPRYRQMVADALEGNRIIGMVMLRPGYEGEYEGNPPIYEIGTAGVIANVEELADGRYNIVLRGITKFRVASEDQSRPYRMADVVAIPETVGEDERDPLRRHRPLLLELLALDDPDATPTPDELPDAALVDGLAQFLGMSRFDRMDLLRQSGSLARADALVAMLDRGELSR